MKVKVLLLLTDILFIQIVFSQDTIQWENIELIDTMDYSAFSRSNTDLNSYPPSCLFDADYSTCWVAKRASEESNPEIFVRLPENGNILNIYAGYGKTKSLFYKNSRPKKLKISIYAGVNPEGYVSEIATIYKAIKIKQEQIVTLEDTNTIQNIQLNVNKEDLVRFRRKIKDQFHNKYNMPVSQIDLILRIEILDNIEGSKYEDICISELFFNDRYLSGNTGFNKPFKEVVVNEKENALLIKKDNQEIVAYKDNDSVIQLIDVSKDNKWAILISMPSKIQGRVQTTYLLVDLLNQQVINEELEKATGNYLNGSELYFEYGKQNSLFLNYYTKDLDQARIELK